MAEQAVGQWIKFLYGSYDHIVLSHYPHRDSCNYPYLS